MALKHEKPNTALLRKLQGLALTAQKLELALIGENCLPNNFPRQQVENYLEVLIDLQDGTAEGCREPLILIRNEFTRIGNDHILDTETAKEIEAEQSPDMPPPLRTGGLLDAAFGAVSHSISRALDEYRIQASETPDESFTPELAVQNLPTAVIQEAITQTNKVETSLNTFMAEAHEILDKEEESADNFIRLVQDAQSANRLTRGMLRGKKIVKPWFRAAGRTLQKYPVLIRGAGRGLRIGIAFTRPMAERWNALLGEVIDFGLGQIDKLGKMAEKIATNVEALQQEWREIPEEEPLPPT